MPALELPVDGLSEEVRMEVRGAIEAATEAELTWTLGRAAWERAVTTTGYRHGTIARTVVTGVGPVVLSVPRARLAQADGTRQEWQCPVLPRYARRTAALDATLARLYLSGASTRDLRRAVAPLFGSRAVSKSATSRVVTQLQGEYPTWRSRFLAEEPIAYLYLDGQRHRVQAGGHVACCSVLMALGVRTTGQKVVLGLRVAGDEQTAAWQRLLEDLTARGLRRPEVVISDGSKGATAALEATWLRTAHQRCLVHKLRNLVACVPRSLQAPVVRDFQTMTPAADRTTVAAAIAAFRRTWATRWSAVVVSLGDAGNGLIAFTALPVAQWKCLRTTNAIEYICGEVRRRTKTKGVLPNPEAILTLLWGTLAPGGFQRRKLHGYRTMSTTPLRQAVYPGSPTRSSKRISTVCGTQLFSGHGRTDVTCSATPGVFDSVLSAPRNQLGCWPWNEPAISFQRMRGPRVPIPQWFLPLASPAYRTRAGRMPEAD